MPLSTLVNTACKTAHDAIKRNAPTILTVLGCVGVVGTVVVTSKQAPKAYKAIQDAKDPETGEIGLKTALRASGKHYIPVVLTAGTTIACIIASNVMNQRAQASLMSAYAAMATYYNSYRKEVIERHGEEEDKEIMATICRLSPEYHVIDLDCPDIKLTFIDTYGNAVTCYEREMIDAEYHFNRNYALWGYATLADWYTMSGINATNPNRAEEIGWSHASGMAWVDFEHRIDEKDPSICHLDYTWGPCEEDLEGYFY